MTSDALSVFPSSCLPAEPGPLLPGRRPPCERRRNVVEQTPSRLRVAAHFVCSIYQSEPDSEIYEGNKGGYQLRGKQRESAEEGYACLSHYFWGRDEKTLERKSRWPKKKICKVFPSAHPRRPPEISEQLLRRCRVTKRKAEESSWQRNAVCKRGLSHLTQFGITGQRIIFPPGPIPGTLYFPPCEKYYPLRLCI